MTEQGKKSHPSKKLVSGTVDNFRIMGDARQATVSRVRSYRMDEGKSSVGICTSNIGQSQDRNHDQTTNIEEVMVGKGAVIGYKDEDG